jgi:hypothetical protein
MLPAKAELCNTVGPLEEAGPSASEMDEETLQVQVFWSKSAVHFAPFPVLHVGIISGLLHLQAESRTFLAFALLREHTLL